MKLTGKINLTIAILIAMLLTTCLAEDVPQEILPLMLTAEELGPGFTLDGLDSFVVEDFSGDVFSFPRQRFVGEENGITLRVTVSYGRAPSMLELPRMWRSLTNEHPPAGLIPEVPALTGDEDFLLPYSRSSVAFIKGSAHASITVTRSDDDISKEEQKLLELKTLILDKMNGQGVGGLNPFLVEFSDGLSDTGAIIVEGTKTSGEFPYRYSAYLRGEDLDELPFSVPLTSAENGSFVIETGSLQPGSYTLVISGDDVLGRSFEYRKVFVVADTGESGSITATKDTSIHAKNPHRNEGANAHLTLEKVQGKTTRSVVGFNFAEINLIGLSRATLVLTIDSSQAVNGWGNGRTISAQAITTPWQEGNGWNFGLKKKDQIAGNGSGATWFSPVDEDISNESSNSITNWAGATNSVYPPTAPAVQINNFQSGEVAFDVTADILNGAENGWLVLKDQENVGSKISFYSREGAAAAGNPDLAPRLILEFGEPVASAPLPAGSLLAKTGLGSISTKLRATQNGGELRSVREVLQENSVAALATEQLLYEATRTNPVLNIAARTAYRSWLAEDLRIAAVPVRFT